MPPKPHLAVLLRGGVHRVGPVPSFNAVAGPSRLPYSTSTLDRRNLALRHTRPATSLLTPPAPSADPARLLRRTSQRYLSSKSRLVPLLAALPVTITTDPEVTESWYQPLSDLIVSSPLPLGMTIILTGLVLRFTLTFPVAWTVRRQAERANLRIKAETKEWIETHKDDWFRKAKQDKIGPEEFMGRMAQNVSLAIARTSSVSC